MKKKAAYSAAPSKNLTKKSYSPKSAFLDLVEPLLRKTRLRSRPSLDFFFLRFSFVALVLEPMKSTSSI